MAITKVPQTSRLQIKVESGTTTSGQTAYKVRSYSNLKPGAADADVHAVGQALAALQQHPVASISRQDDAQLISQ